MADRLACSEANAKRIAFVEQCFGSNGQPLAIPQRVLVGEGVLTKMCRKKPKPRQFFLFNDILVYGNIVISKKKANGDYELVETLSNRLLYNKQRILQLENVHLQSVPDDASLRNGWQIISPSKSFTVYAATASEKSEWMAHINKCAEDLITKHGRKKIDAEPSPVWVPDADAPVCMHCNKSEFTVINRRHHCRKCGRVCCNACTSKRMLLKHQSSKPLRVCVTCYNKLKAPPADGGCQTVEAVGNDTNPDSSGEDSSDSEDEQSAAVADGSQQPTFYRGSQT